MNEGHVQRGAGRRLQEEEFAKKKHPADARRRRPRRLVRRRRGLVAQCKKTTSAPHCTLCCGSSTATTDQVRVATIWAGRAFRREAPFAHADASLLQDRRRPRPNPPDTEPLGPIPRTGSSSAPLPRLLLHLPGPQHAGAASPPLRRSTMRAVDAAKIPLR